MANKEHARLLNRKRAARWRERNREQNNKRVRETYKPRYKDRKAILEALMQERLMLQHQTAYEVKCLIRALNVPLERRG